MTSKKDIKVAEEVLKGLLIARIGLLLEAKNTRQIESLIWKVNNRISPYAVAKAPLSLSERLG